MIMFGNVKPGDLLEVKKFGDVSVVTVLYTMVIRVTKFKVYTDEGSVWDRMSRNSIPWDGEWVEISNANL